MCLYFRCKDFGTKGVNRLKLNELPDPDALTTAEPARPGLFPS